VRRVCAEFGYHHSTYYYWLPLVERHGLEIPAAARAARRLPRGSRWSTQPSGGMASDDQPGLFYDLSSRGA